MNQNAKAILALSTILGATWHGTRRGVQPTLTDEEKQRSAPNRVSRGLARGAVAGAAGGAVGLVARDAIANSGMSGRKRKFLAPLGGLAAGLATANLAGALPPMIKQVDYESDLPPEKHPKLLAELARKMADRERRITWLLGVPHPKPKEGPDHHIIW